MKSSDLQQLRDQGLATEAADWFFRVNREYRFRIARPVSHLSKFNDKFGQSNGANWLDIGGVFIFERSFSRIRILGHSGLITNRERKRFTACKISRNFQ
jgi:hypothetical protein